jgi:hypothetical protein
MIATRSQASATSPMSWEMITMVILQFQMAQAPAALALPDTLPDHEEIAHRASDEVEILQSSKNDSNFNNLIQICA